MIDFAEPVAFSDAELLECCGCGSTEAAYYDHLRGILKPSRLRHSLGVMWTAVQAAPLLGLDVRKARIAGLLHDCGKAAAGALEHGPVGAEIARRELGVEDEEILGAIRWHTVGRVPLTPLEKLIFAADYAEPFRPPLPAQEEIRRCLVSDPDRAVWLLASATVDYLKTCGKEVGGDTMAVMQYYKKGGSAMADSKEQVKALCAALAEKQAQDITVIDIGGVSPIADYFVITHGNNTPHVDSLVQTTEETMGKLGVECKSLEGIHGGRWVLLDYRDVIVHVFSKEDRLFYDLERIWRDGKRVDPAEL